jgi:teichuronic acid biosynthesis glycosyltransferase TuaG
VVGSGQPILANEHFSANFFPAQAKLLLNLNKELNVCSFLRASYQLILHQYVFKHRSIDAFQNTVAAEHVDINKFHMLFKNDVATRTVMVRSNIWQRFPKELRYAEDYYLWMSIIFFGGSAAKINLTLAYTFKEDYGQEGLSSNLLAMHQGVKSVLRWLNFQKKISYWLYLVASTYELLKYIYRISCVFVKMRLNLGSHHD